MGKVKAKESKPKAPDSLELQLFAPGMTPLHRAGLGGLAATLEALKRRRKLGLIAENDLPGEWIDDHPPWELDEDRIKLHFGKPENAGDYLRKLFAFAFGIKDKLIDLPGTYRDELSRAVRAELQLGLTLTFLQFGPHRKLDPATTQYFDVGGDGKAEIAVGLRACHSYLHQEGLQKLKLIDQKGRLNQKASELPSAFNPGAVVRHNAFGTETRIDELPPGRIAACFAIVGCLSLAVNRGVGVLLIPEVVDLEKFARARPRMTPTTLRECRITGASDAALQAQVRLRSKGELSRHGLEGIYALRFRPTQWNEKQKTRVDALHVSIGAEEQLTRFDLALRYLPPRIRSREETIKGGRGKKPPTHPVWFWTDSIVRPLAADNIARGNRWYRNLVNLNPQLDQIRIYEGKGLHDMIENIPWEDQGESTVVRAVHQAMRQRFAQIADQYKNNPKGMEKRWQTEFLRWRIAFAGAKTESLFRKVICDFFSRAGLNDVLSQGWSTILPMLTKDKWELTRDLSLLALASYSKRPSDKENNSETAID